MRINIKSQCFTVLQYSRLFSYGGNFRIFHIIEHYLKLPQYCRLNITILSCTNI